MPAYLSFTSIKYIANFLLTSTRNTKNSYYEHGHPMSPLPHPPNKLVLSTTPSKQISLQNRLRCRMAPATSKFCMITVHTTDREHYSISRERYEHAYPNYTKISS